MIIVLILQGNMTIRPFYSHPFTPQGKGILYAVEGTYEKSRRMLDLLQENQSK
jgi:hypothetical protein